MDPSVFKECQVCNVAWRERDDFLADPDVVLIGYQANFVVLEKGLFLFNHSCRGTMSVQVSEFSDLYSGPIFQTRKTGTDACAGYCLHRNVLKPCPAECECAYVREILQLLKKPQTV